MGDKTSIGWTNATWNPVVGCTRVSAGCDNCYAFALHNRRYAANVRHALIWSGIAEVGDRQNRSYEGWPQNVKRVGVPPGGIGWPAHARSLGVRLGFPAQYDVPFARVQLLPKRLDQPLRWRTPRRIFVNSMSDLFHEDVPDEFIDRVFATMMLATWHTLQVLTKRPDRMRAYMADLTFERLIGACNKTANGLEPWTEEQAPNLVTIAQRAVKARFRAGDSTAFRRVSELSASKPLPNVWLCVSVEDAETANARIPVLLETPAAVRFISAEPLLGPVELLPYLYPTDAMVTACKPLNQNDATRRAFSQLVKAASRHMGWTGLDWVIVGGESGGSRTRPARYMQLAWVRAIREQCRAAGVAYFGKQDYSPGGGPKRHLPGDLGDQEWPDEMNAAPDRAEVPA